MRILVSGMVAGDPGQGGATWAVLQYVLGLRRLGHDVWFTEPVGEVRPEVAAYFEAVVSEFRLGGRAALVGPAGVVGQLPDGADLLLDIAGMLRDGPLVDRIPVRVYLDLDPGFTQLWHSQGVDMRLDGHTHFATVGLGLGTPGCPVPTCGRDWIRTLPPVVLERWPLAGEVRHRGFTTVGNWRSYGSVEHDGVRYGQRAHSVRGLIELPTLTAEPIMPALSIHPDETADLEALAAHGWRLLSAEQLASTPARYHELVRSSKAELGIPKEGYVAGRTGWFSDRSACYLASGRPVVLQDTGYAAFLPAGEGLLAYTTAAEAAAAIEEVCADYEAHRRAARAIAEEHLDSDRVLGRLLEAL